MGLFSPLLFLALWLLGFLLIWRVPAPRLRPEEENRDPPSLTVVVPARNEADNLPGLLKSLTAQKYPNLEILVVDDQSSDGTGRIAAGLGARVIEAGPLPAGWIGKPWACWQGAQAARGELLLFLDADTRMAPDGLRKLVDTCRTEGGLVSVQPYHRVGGGHEQLAAFFNWVSLAAAGVFGLRRESAKPVGAFGPCNLCRRADYFAVGGHSVAGSAVVEGAPMARAFLEAGLPVRCLGGKGSVEFRMYPENLQSLIEGFVKSTASGAQGLPAHILALIAAWLTAGGEAARHLAANVMGGSGDGILLWSAAYLLFAAQLYRMLIPVGSFRPSTALLYPIPLAVFVLVCLRSLLDVRIRKRVRWKGRELET